MKNNNNNNGNNNNNNNNNNKKSQQVVDEIKKVGKKTDPQGCYTGRTDDNRFQKPVQDQDDL